MSFPPSKWIVPWRAKVTLSLRLIPETPIASLTSSVAPSSSNPPKTAASNAASSASPSATLPKPGDDQFPTCRSPPPSQAPFCHPAPNSEVWTSNSYYVTWDADFYPLNSTITIEINYANASDNKGGISAYSSPKVENRYGYVIVEMKNDWLQGTDSNNLTFYMVQGDPASEERVKNVVGPMVKLTEKPKEHLKAPPKTPPPDKLGLFIGLPVGLAIFIVLVGGLMFGMKGHRRIGLGNVMGRRGKGYAKIGSVGRRRRERDAIQLERYKDDPNRGTLNDLFQVNQDSRRAAGDAFREDVRSMKSWKT
ncbi:MAG: hypothetical protein Q9160_007112 [Pyrenula sp. 1 TL-2023]